MMKCDFAKKEKFWQKDATNLPSAVEGRTPDFQADPDKSPDQADFYAPGQSSDKSIPERNALVNMEGQDHKCFLTACLFTLNRESGWPEC